MALASALAAAAFGLRARGGGCGIRPAADRAAKGVGGDDFRQLPGLMPSFQGLIDQGQGAGDVFFGGLIAFGVSQRLGPGAI